MFYLQYAGEDDEELPCVSPLFPVVDLFPVSELSVLSLVTTTKRRSSQIMKHDKIPLRN